MTTFTGGSYNHIQCAHTGINIHYFNVFKDLEDTYTLS